MLFARVKLTMAANPAVERPAVAQASLDLNGRLIRAQATGADMREAVNLMSDRLRMRVQRAVRNWAAIRGGKPVPLPHEWRHQSMPTPRMPYFPRPPEERKVIRRKAYMPARQTPDKAVAGLELLDYDFYLFTERPPPSPPSPPRQPTLLQEPLRPSPHARQGLTHDKD